MVFPGGAAVKNLPAKAGGMVSIPGSGRSPGEGNGNPLQYSCLENSMDRGAWWATVHRVTKSQTWLSTHTHTRAGSQRPANSKGLTGVVGSTASCFHARPLPHICSQKLRTGIFVTELPSNSVLQKELCFSSPNSLSEHVIWLSITEPRWHSKEQTLDVSRSAMNQKIQWEKCSSQWRRRWATVTAYSFGQAFNQ